MTLNRVLPLVNYQCSYSPVIMIQLIYVPGKAFRKKHIKISLAKYHLDGPLIDELILLDNINS